MKKLVREAAAEDIERIVDYFLNSSPEYLLSMGAEPSKLPLRSEWISSIINEMAKPRQEQQIYYVIWQINNVPVGHSNINKIKFGEEGFMHLHMWESENRRKGFGAKFVFRSLGFYFSNFALKRVRCEPFALNPAPARTLSKLGFEFHGEYEAVPGLLSQPQKVKGYSLTRAQWRKMNHELHKCN